MQRVGDGNPDGAAGEVRVAASGEDEELAGVVVVEVVVAIVALLGRGRVPGDGKAVPALDAGPRHGDVRQLVVEAAAGPLGFGAPVCPLGLVQREAKRAKRDELFRLAHVRDARAVPSLPDDVPLAAERVLLPLEPVGRGRVEQVLDAASQLHARRVPEPPLVVDPLDARVPVVDARLPGPLEEDLVALRDDADHSGEALALVRQTDRGVLWKRRAHAEAHRGGRTPAARVSRPRRRAARRPHRPQVRRHRLQRGGEDDRDEEAHHHPRVPLARPAHAVAPPVPRPNRRELLTSTRRPRRPALDPHRIDPHRLRRLAPCA
mmetsp:Transcript_8143/g.25112  ORF Transcript_8143/g.25112 Transcript_8143/m.25112 type:complete len:320 (-) Transcript_8143:134-1093(-)